MTMSSDQATEAAIFLTLYHDSIKVLQQSAVADNSNEVIQSFTDRIIKISGSQTFKRICDPHQPSNFQQKDPRLRELEKDVRAFQFSHYVFLKYLPNFLTLKGDSKELISYMRAQNSRFSQDLGV